MTKQFWKSWTFWFGVAQIAYGAVGLISHNLDQPTARTLIVTGLGTIGFRFKTIMGVTLN